MIHKFLLLDFTTLLLGVFSLFFSHAFAATESVRIIRQDCTGYSNCYTSLSAWDVAEQRDLVASNEIAVARIEGTWTSPDTIAVDIDGWTTGVDNYIRIYTTTEARHSGVWNINKYRLEPTDAGALRIADDYVIVDGLQIRVVSPTAQRSEFASAWNTGGVVTLSNSIIRGSGANSVGVGVSNAQVGSIILYNNIIYNTQNQYFGGVRFNGVGTLRAYNNTIIDSYYGFRRSNGTIIAKNNIVVNPISSAYVSDSSVWGTGSNYNISTDGTSTGGVNDKINQTVLFRDSTTNYHLSSSDTSAKDAGVDLSADPNLPFSVDIDGATRSGTWDIGADEYGAATESVRIIRQDCTGYSNCYTSLSAWEAGENRDLTATDEIAVARIEGTWTNPDTTAVTINGWTTGVDNYIRIYTTTEARHTGKWDNTKYRLENGGWGAKIIDNQQNYTRIEGLQILHSGGSDSSAGIYSIAFAGVLVKDSIVKKTTTSIGNGIIIAGASTASSGVVNSVAYGGWGVGINVSTFGGYGYAYNTTSYGNNYGYNGFYPQNLKNCIGASNTIADFARDGSYAVNTTTCASSDATANTFTDTGSRINQTFSFTNPASGDFHISTSDTGAKDFGTNLSADPIYAFTTDIDGTTRSGTWDIGADEYIFVDTTPPIRSGSSPSGLFPSGTTSATLSLLTDENATCKYGTTQNIAYASIPSTFTTTGATSHATSVITTDSRSYTYYIRCTDTTGNPNTDDYSISFSINSPPPKTDIDIAAPSVPIGVTATVISPSRVTLTWEASRDDRGVIGYYIYRNGKQITTTTEARFTDINLTPLITYVYTVSAYDTANNFSPQSVEVSVVPKNVDEVVVPSPRLLVPEPPVLTQPSHTFANERLVSYGMKNSVDILELQKILQYEGFLPNTTFALDGVFLEATKNAVIKFQEEYGLVPHDGKVGPMTKKKLNELYGSISTGSTPTATYLLRDLTLGSRGEDVRKLQQILNADPATKITSSGSGSPGNESTYFGLSTKSAVIKYQKKYNISPASGYVGPLTRGKLEGR